MKIFGLSITRELPESKPTSGKRSLSGLPRVGKRSFTTSGVTQAASSGRLESSWSVTPMTADAIVYQTWLRVVARARQAAEDYDHYRKFIQLVRDNVAGPKGFNLNPRIIDPSGTMDTAASKAIETAYDDFSRRGNFDVTGTLSRSDAERLAVTTWATDSEVIINIRRGDKYPHGIAFQFIDPVRLDPNQYHKLPNGNMVRHGIEFDEDGKPLNYYFRDYDQMQVGYVSGYQGQRYTIIPARDIIHWFVPEMVNQKRGLVPGRTALWRMRMLQGFEDAAIVNARVGASKMGFLSDPEGGDEDEDFEIDAEPGTFEDIGNRKFEAWNPQFPEQSIETFTRSMLRSIGAGLNTSYHNIANDLTSVNFSSIRQGALDEREVWKGIQFSFAGGVCMPMYFAWLESALLRQIPRVNGSPLRFDRIEKYKSVLFTGRRWAWIDPAAEQSANERAVAQGFKSRSDVIEETSDRDPEDTWNTIERENKELKKRGIVPLIPSGAMQPQQASANPNTNNQNENA